jgi:SAM-dependent methyltransferase
MVARARGTDVSIVIEWAPETYGNDWAPYYDERDAHLGDTEIAVEALADLAQGGPVLELGSGTGRLAIPLAKLGLEVVGVEASPLMMERLRQKPGGEAVQMIQADFADFAIAGKFSLIFMSCNTLFLLPRQEQQVSCISCAARHLAPTGKFVTELCVPSVLTGDASAQVISMDSDSVTLQTMRHDVIAQQVFRQRAILTGDGIHFGLVRCRYIWPAELDLMAQLAGLRLSSRWSGWERGTFTAESGGHISVYTAKGNA